MEFVHEQFLTIGEFATFLDTFYGTPSSMETTIFAILGLLCAYSISAAIWKQY